MPAAGTTPSPHLAHALAAHRAGRVEEADAAYREVLADDPSSADAWHMYGVLALQSGDLTTALERLCEALELEPSDPTMWTNLGNARMLAAEEALAAEAFERATELAPTLAEAWLGLGGALRKIDRLDESVRAYRRAVAQRSDWTDAHNGLGIALKQDGLLDEAADAYRRALELSPDDSRLHINLGHALGDSGHHADARRAYECALALAPTSADAHYALFAARYDDQHPASAEAHLRAALSTSPEHHQARYALAMLRCLAGDRGQAAEHISKLPSDLEFLRESMHYVDEHRTPQTRFFADSFRLLSYAMGQASIEGVVLELGVRRGISINHIAREYEGRIYGFDAFEGLPSAWGPRPPGAYSTRGAQPEVRSNVTLVEGWFQDTLPPFAERHPGPIRFLNVDCDLYASTTEALEVLGPRLVPGSIVVFDEMLENPGWQGEEHRALLEVAGRLGLSYEHVAFGISTKQVALHIVDSSK